MIRPSVSLRRMRGTRTSSAGLAAVLLASVHGIAALATPDLLDGVSQERTVEGAIDVAWRGIAGLAAS